MNRAKNALRAVAIHKAKPSSEENNLPMRMENLYKQHSAKLELFIFTFILVGSFFQCISVAVANSFLGCGYFLSLLYAFQNRTTVSTRIKDNAIVLVSLLLFLILLLPSALLSPEIGIGMKLWFSNFFVRCLPFLVLLIIIPKPTYCISILLALVASFMVDCLASPFLGWKYGRLNGIYGHFMVFAGFACLILPVLLAFLLESVSRRKFVIPIFISFFYCCAILLLNGTRGAWVALLLPFLLLLCVYGRKHIFKVVTILLLSIGLCVTVLNSSYTSHRLTGFTDVNSKLNSERVLLWQSSIQMFKDHPVVGVGLGMWQKEYLAKYISPKATENELRHAHSVIFHTLAESGLVGLMGILQLFLLFTVQCIKEFRKNKNVFSLIFLCSLLAFGIQGLSEYTLAHSAVIKSFWTLAGCCYVLMRSDIINIFHKVIACRIT